MDYKKLIKSRKIRMALLDVLSFVPDKTMIKWQYRIKTGRKLDLENPKRYTEKIQWYKLFYRDPLMVQCADKYEVRKYVESLGLGHILNKCYGVFNSPDEINFDKLPNQFVLKDTLGGGGTSVIICKDKKNADLEAYRRQMNEWVHTKVIPSGGREWVYYEGAKKHRIIAEKIIDYESTHGLTDYKFICFNGKPVICQVICDRILGETIKVGTFDMNFKKVNVREAGHEVPEEIDCPYNFKEMVTIVNRLSEQFLHVRVDLYNTGQEIIFGELTFFDSSGYAKYDPDKYDYKLGSYFKIKQRS